MIWAAALLAAAQVGGAMLDWKAAGIEPLDWRIIGGGEHMALFVRPDTDTPPGHFRIWLRFEGAGEAALETAALPGGKAASVTELDELDCANHLMGSVQKTAYSGNNLKGARAIITHRGEPFRMEAPDPNSLMAEIFTFCPAGKVTASAKAGPTSSDEDAFLASTAEQEALKRTARVIACVENGVAALGHGGQRESARIQAVRATCQPELVAYSRWLDDHGYNTWSKGFNLTALQRHIDKTIQAASAARATPTHQ